MCHPIPLPVYHHTECLDYSKPAGLCFASRRKYGEKNSIAMIAGRHIFTPLFWRERHSWHNIGQEIWGQDELFYVMLWHKRGEWWGIGMDGSLLILWSLYSPSFSARLSSARVWWQSGISSLWITPPFLSHWRHLGVLNVDDGSSLLYHRLSDSRYIFRHSSEDLRPWFCLLWLKSFYLSKNEW